MILFDELDEKFNDYEKILDKSFIKIDESQKCLNLFQMSRFFSFDYCFRFFKIHFDFISSHDHFKKFCLCDMKLAFIDVCLNVCLAQSLKNFAHVLYMLFLAVAVNDNVVQICNDEFVEIIHQRIIHKISKSR